MRNIIVVLVIALASCSHTSPPGSPSGPTAAVGAVVDCLAAPIPQIAIDAEPAVASAIAQASWEAAKNGLERLAGKYGNSVVACLVSKIIHEAQGYAQADPISATKSGNGRRWMSEQSFTVTNADR